MWIEILELENFRSVGIPGIELHASPSLNTIVGPNNVGKSSLFAAAMIAYNSARAVRVRDCSVTPFQYRRSLGAKTANKSTSTIPATPTIFAARGAPQRLAIAPEDMLPRAKA